MNFIKQDQEQQEAKQLQSRNSLIISRYQDHNLLNKYGIRK